MQKLKEKFKKFWEILEKYWVNFEKFISVFREK